MLIFIQVMCAKIIQMCQHQKSNWQSGINFRVTSRSKRVKLNNLHNLIRNIRKPMLPNKHFFSVNILRDLYGGIYLYKGIIYRVYIRSPILSLFKVCVPALYLFLFTCILQSGTYATIALPYYWYFENFRPGSPYY